jgi:hypothetical protein
MGNAEIGDGFWFAVAAVGVVSAFAILTLRVAGTGRVMTSGSIARRGWALAAVLAAALVLGSCGGAPASDAPKAAASPSGQSQPSAPASAVPPPPSRGPSLRPSPTARSDASPTPWATTADGAALVPGGQTGRVSTPDQKYALTIPDGWQTLAVSGELDAASVAALAGIPAADLQSWRSALSQIGVSLLAVDFDAARSGKIVGMWVGRVQVGVNQKLDDYARQLEAGFAKQPGIVGSVDSKPAELMAGPAYRFTFRASAPNLGAPNTDQFRISYITGTIPYMFIVGFEGPWDDRDALAPLFDKVMTDFNPIG